MALKTLKARIKPIDTRRGGKIATERIRGSKLQGIRERVLLRDNYTCKQCGRVSVDNEVDHIMPLYLGGAESDENRQTLCNNCHKKKSEGEENERGGGSNLCGS